MIRSAFISPDGKFRYMLSRQWNYTKPSVCWVMLNPSTADADVDDPTIRKCIRFSSIHGFGGIYVVNVYAYRATNPKVLRSYGYPRGDDNDNYIASAQGLSSKTIVAWGNNAREDEARHTMSVLSKPVWCLGTNDNGSPKHPLMLAYITPLVEYVLLP